MDSIHNSAAGEATPCSIRRSFMKKLVIRDVIVVLFAVTALVIAALNLHISLNMLGSRDEE